MSPGTGELVHKVDQAAANPAGEGKGEHKSGGRGAVRTWEADMHLVFCAFSMLNRKSGAKTVGKEQHGS